MTRLWVGSLVVIGSMAACTQLLGDDFVVVVVAGGGSSSSSSSSGGGGSMGDGGGTSQGGGGSAPVMCDVFAQDCDVASANNKCIPVTSGDGLCVASGSLPHEATCVAVHPDDDFDDCGEGLICHEGVCLHICIDGPVDPDPDYTCPNSGACFLGTAYNWCGPACNPLQQDCATGEGCYLSGQSGNVTLTCAMVVDPPAPPNGPCTYLNDCEVGWQCTPFFSGCNGNGNGCCGELCEVGVTTCTTAGMICVGFSDPPADYPTLGVCWYDPG